MSSTPPPTPEPTSRRRRRLLAAMVITALVATLLVAATPARPAGAAGVNASSVTVVHGIQGIPVDVYVNGGLLLPNFQPGAIAGPLLLDPADYRVTIYTAGASPSSATPVIDQQVAVPAGRNVSLVAHPSTAGAPMLSAFVNDVTALAQGQARVAVRHTANAPAVDVTVNGSVAIGALTNPSEAVTQVPGGTYTVAVQPAGGHTALIGPAALDFNAGRLTVVYAISALDGSNLAPVVQTIPTKAPGTSQVSVVHGILGVPVDVYVNGTLLLPDFQPKSIAGPLTLPFGDYDIQIFPAGTHVTPVIDQTVNVPVGAVVSLIAHANTSGAPVLTAFVDDTSPVAVGSARVSVRHTANVGPVDVLVNGADAITNLANPNAADAVLPAATYSVAVEPVGSNTPVLGPTNLGLAAGKLTAVYAVSNLAGTSADLVVQVTDLASGYRLVAADGGVFAFGDAAFAGSTGGIALNQPIVGAASTPSGDGYWLVARDGGVFAFGDAAFFGSTGASALNQPIVGIAATASGRGYRLVAADGGVFAFGDAAFAGSTGGITLNQPIVAIVSGGTGGYWLVARDGGVFAFGSAGYHGSTGGITLNKPIVAAVAAPGGLGYWLAASDGGVFAFGNAPYLGSTGGTTLNRPIVAALASPSGQGYGLVASDGGVFSFGDAGYFGSTGGVALNRPVVAVAG